MKNFSLLFIAIISLCFFSCKNEQKSIYAEAKKSEIIDSVKINFKVIENDKRRKKINSFFKRKFSNNQFNGNILFAENGNIILDCNFGTIKNPKILTQKIKQTTGVLESGIFIRKPDMIYKAKTNGKFEII